MKYLFTLLAVLVAAVGLALVAHNDPGYVLINYGQWSVETSLTLLVVAVVLGFVALYLVLRLLAATFAVPGRLQSWRTNRRAVRARRATSRGLTALAEGHWLKAERDLSRYAADSDMPLLNFLAAARAAQELGEHARRDHFLSMAHRSGTEGELATGVTQAQLQIQDGQLEQALATLMHLRSVTPKNVYVLQLLQRVYQRLGSWDELAALLPELRKRKVLSEDAAVVLERQVYAALLRNAQEHANVDRLHEVWGHMPRNLRQQPELLAAYARGLLAGGGGEECEELLREALRNVWDAELVRLYGLVEGKDVTEQLATAEEWLKRHQRHPLLLLSLGRLATRAQLWGKARSYLEASAGMEARAETYRVLGELLERLGEGNQAREYYHKGLVLVAGDGRHHGPVVPLKRFPLVTRPNKKSS